MKERFCVFYILFLSGEEGVCGLLVNSFFCFLVFRVIGLCFSKLYRLLVFFGNVRGRRFVAGS